MAKAKAKPKKKKEDPQEVATSVLENTEEEQEDNPEMYQTDPDLVEEDIIINTVARPWLLPKGTHRNSSERLLRGDRVQGRYYKKMVTKHKIQGLQLCCQLEKSYLEELERCRLERTGDRCEEWVKDAWSKKSPESEREAMKGRR